jgi:hypothetical protein
MKRRWQKFHGPRFLEPLERRLLLSGLPPHAINQAYSTPEDTPLRVTAGATYIWAQGNGYVFSGTEIRTAADGIFSTERTNHNSVVLKFEGNEWPNDENYWRMDFAAADGADLHSGTYPNAMRFPFMAPGSPGLTVVHSTASCDTLTGSFTILDPGEATGPLTHFAANFNQRCLDSNSGISGKIRLNYNPPGYLSGVLHRNRDPERDPLRAILVQAPSHGKLDLRRNGTLTYIPARNFVGTDSFKYRSSDGTSKSNTATVRIIVTPVNDAPTFTAGPNQAINEDAAPQSVAGWASKISPGPGKEAKQQLTFSVTANSNPYLFSSGPAISPDGTLTYTPRANANGTASITVVASDNGGTAAKGKDTSKPAIFKITVNAVADAPVAMDDFYELEEGSTLTISPATPSTGIFFNSQPGDRIGMGRQWSHTLADGTFSFEKRDGAAGVVFMGADFPSTYSITSFAAPGDSPLIPGDYLSAGKITNRLPDQAGMIVEFSNSGCYTEGGSFTILQFDLINERFAADFEQHCDVGSPPLLGQVRYNYLGRSGILANDSDVDTESLTLIIESGPAHGILRPNQDGTFSYTPDSGFAGTDSFSYRAFDGELTSNIAAVTLTVKPAPF